MQSAPPKKTKRWLKIIKSRYFIATLFFVTWWLFFDENNFFEQRRINQRYKELEKDKAYFLQEIAKNKQDLNDLMSNQENLEKFAREKYLMKKDNEDIFVIINDTLNN